MTADDLSGVCIDGQPDPLLVAFVVNEGPELIHLYSQLAFGLGDDFCRFGHCLIVGIHMALQPTLRDPCGLGNAC